MDAKSKGSSTPSEEKAVRHNTFRDDKAALEQSQKILR